MRIILTCFVAIVISACVVHAGVEDVLRDHLRGQIAARVEVSTDTAIYSSIDLSQTNFVRNPNCWMDAPQMTAISPWNSGDLGRMGLQVGFAISSQVIAAARHAPPGVGTTICFVTMDSQNVFRQIVGYQVFGNLDVWLGILDEPLPPSIHPLRILNTDSLRSWPEVSLPAILTNQKHQIFSYNWRVVRPNSGWSSSVSYFNELPGVLGVGDSGHPACVLMNGELLVFAVVTGIHSGPNLREVLRDWPAVEAVRVMTSTDATNWTPAGVPWSIVDELMTNAAVVRTEPARYWSLQIGGL